ncbi:MAG: MFS transporter [Bacteroidales bacterium]|nr:MFS transporter [Bacteroidales bacterium]
MIKGNKLLPLYLTNFLGVFDDNLLKSLISFISIYWVAQGKESLVIMMATGFLVIPFILFSPYSGFISKTLLKQRVVIWLKVAEIFIMAIAIFGFWVENIFITLFAMFLMGLQSTFFSPAKFALVRDIGGEEKSSIGTGTVEMTTFFGVLIGTFVAGLLSDSGPNRLIWIGLMFLFVTVSGLVSALKIKAVEPKPLTIRIKPLNFINFIIRKYKWSDNNVPGLNLIVLGLSLFWMIASMIQMNLLIHCPITLGFSNTETGIIMALVAVSIGIGSYLSGLVAGDKIAVGLIPIGGTGFVLGIFAIFLFNPDGLVFISLIMFTALMAGFFKTPLNAWMQVKVKGRKLGDAVAYNNMINFIFILFSALIFGLAENLMNSLFVFFVIGLLSLFMILLLSFKVEGVKKSIINIFKLSKDGQ